MNRCPKCGGFLNMRPIGFDCRNCSYSSGFKERKNTNTYSDLRDQDHLLTVQPTLPTHNTNGRTRSAIRAKKKNYFQRIWAYVTDSFFVRLFNNRNYQYNKIVYQYYPKSKFDKKQIQFYRDILIEMDRVFTTHFDFNSNKLSDFFICPSLQSNYKAQAVGIEYYRSDYARIKEEAIEKIEELLKLKNRYQLALEFYETQMRKAEKTRRLLEENRQFQTYFKNIYQKKVYTLNVVRSQCKKINTQLREKVQLCDEVIRELEKMKKPTFFDLVFDTAAAVVTAPIRHGLNLLGGIFTGDGAKIVQSGAMLGLGFFGIGAIADALDAIDGIDAIHSINIDHSSLEFVDPHERILADGTSIWIDGDGDTTVDLTVEQGGGYLRR
jgi:hypothetical protein